MEKVENRSRETSLVMLCEESEGGHQVLAMELGSEQIRYVLWRMKGQH